MGGGVVTINTFLHFNGYTTGYLPPLPPPHSHRAFLVGVRLHSTKINNWLKVKPRPTIQRKRRNSCKKLSMTFFAPLGLLLLNYVKENFEK